MNAAPTIALVAGEASGDLLGAGLISALRDRYPDANFVGIGGPKMIAAGQTAWWPAERLSVMGLVEVLKHLPSLLRLRRELVAKLLEAKPDVFVGIDAPDFNLGVEKQLKARGIRTVHYVSPSVWAWRESRAAKLGESADRVLCLFPMEPAIYAKHGVDARFVGHPLAEAFADEPDRVAARVALGLPVDGTVLAVLPGSRAGEIARLAEPFLLAAGKVAQTVSSAGEPDRTFQSRPISHGSGADGAPPSPTAINGSQSGGAPARSGPNHKLHIIAPMANARCRHAFEAVVKRLGMEAAVTITDGRAHEAMVASDVVLLASGTAALEAMLAKRPMVVGYRINALTHFIVKRFGLMRTNVYSLPNVLAGETLVPELMQENCTPDALADAVLRYLRDPSAGVSLIEKFRAIHASLRRDADREAAAAVAELLERP